ncbi:LacI family DNA-binding transcriptional regulator, partial [Enterococcus faecalis]
VGRHCGQVPTLQAVVTNGDEFAAGIQAVIERPLFLVGQEQTLFSEILNFSTICHPLMQLGEKATHLFLEKRPKTIQLTST